MGKFQPIASAEQTAGRKMAEDWAAENIDDKLVEILNYQAIDQWYESFSSVLLSCIEEMNVALSTLDSHFDMPEFGGVVVATLEDAKDAVLAAIAPLEELQQASGRTMDFVDELMRRFRSAGEEVSEAYLQLASHQDATASSLVEHEAAQELLSSAQLLGQLVEAVQEMSNLAEAAVGAAHYATDLLDEVPKASGTVNAFSSLSSTVGDFPLPDPDVVEQEIARMVAAASENLSAQLSGQPQ